MSQKTLEKIIAAMWALILLGGTAWATVLQTRISKLEDSRDMVLGMSKEIDLISRQVAYIRDQVDKLRDKK